MIESKWIPRVLGWTAVALAFTAGLNWDGGLGYVTLVGTVAIIWTVVGASMSLGAIDAYRKMTPRI